MRAIQTREVPFPWRLGRKTVICALSFVALSSVAACGKTPPPRISGRLWIDAFPTGPKTSIHAFALGDIRGRAVGAFYEGSMFRGQHDAFAWKQIGAHDATLRLLQDGLEYPIEIRSCDPSAGFDLCIQMGGDPKGVGRYQSRRRWALPHAGHSQTAIDPAQLIVELAEQDPDLQWRPSG